MPIKTFECGKGQLPTVEAAQAFCQVLDSLATTLEESGQSIPITPILPQERILPRADRGMVVVSETDSGELTGVATVVLSSEIPAARLSLVFGDGETVVAALVGAISETLYEEPGVSRLFVPDPIATEFQPIFEDLGFKPRNDIHYARPGMALRFNQ